MKRIEFSQGILLHSKQNRYLKSTFTTVMLDFFRIKKTQRKTQGD